jgi:hypothetical protein
LLWLDTRYAEISGLVNGRFSTVTPAAVAAVKKTKITAAIADEIGTGRFNPVT